MKTLKRLSLSLLTLTLMLSLSACTSTVRPTLPKQKQPSADGNLHDSGFRGFDTNHFGVISDNARERYNGFLSQYGDRLARKPVLPNDGISAGPSNGVWRIDQQHLDYFKIMTLWRNQGVK